MIVNKETLMQIEGINQSKAQVIMERTGGHVEWINFDLKLDGKRELLKEEGITEQDMENIEEFFKKEFAEIDDISVFRISKPLSKW